MPARLLPTGFTITVDCISSHLLRVPFHCKRAYACLPCCNLSAMYSISARLNSAGGQDSLPYSPSRICNRGFLPISVQASIAAASGTLPEYPNLAPRHECSAAQGHAQSLRDHSPVHRRMLASHRAVDLSARAAGDSPGSCKSGLGNSVAWHRGRQPDLSDPVSVPRGAILSPRDAMSSPRGAFSTPRTLVSGPRGSAKWSDAQSSSPRPDGSKHRLGRSERRSSSRSAQQYSLRPSRSRSESPPRRSAQQRMSTPTNPRSRHFAEQPRHRLGSPKADCFSRRSAELPMPRAACVKPSASSRRLGEADLPSAAHSSIWHPAAATALPPPPPIQPPVKAGSALQIPSQKPLISVKSPFLLASHSSARVGRASTDNLRAVPPLQRADSSPGAASPRDQTAKDRRSGARTPHKGSSLSRHAAEAQPAEHRDTSPKSSTEAKVEHRTRLSSIKAKSHERSRSNKVSSADLKQAQPRNISQAWNSSALPTSSSDAAHTAPPPGSSGAGAVTTAVASLPGTAAKLSNTPDAAHTTPPAATSAAPALALLPVATSLLPASPQSASMPTDPRKRPPAVKSLFSIGNAASPIHKVLPHQVNADKAFLAGDSCQATSDQLKASAIDLKPDSSQHAQHGSASRFLRPTQRAKHGHDCTSSEYEQLSPAALSTPAVAIAAAAVPSEPLDSNLNLAKPSDSTQLSTHQPERTSSATALLDPVRQSQPHGSTPDSEAAVSEHASGALPSAVAAAKQPSGGDIREPTWDEAIRNSGALQLEAKVWYYLDPKVSKLQPC